MSCPFGSFPFSTSCAGLVLIIGLIALFLSIFCQLNDFAPPLFFLVILHPIFCQLCFCSKSSLKEGKGGKRWGCKIAHKKKRGCKIARLAKRWGAKV